MSRPAGSGQVVPHGELYRDLRVLLARGLSVAEAATRLGVSRRTAYRVLREVTR